MKKNKNQIRIMMSVKPETRERIRRLKKNLKSKSEANAISAAIKFADEVVMAISEGKKVILQEGDLRYRLKIGVGD